MKVTLQQIDRGSEEVIIRYRRMTDQLAGIIEYLEGKSEKLAGMKDGQQFFVNIQDILYLESVDGVTFFIQKMRHTGQATRLRCSRRSMYRKDFSGAVNRGCSIFTASEN